MAGSPHIALATPATGEVWVEVSLNYGQWRTRWSEGPYPPGTSVLASFTPPPGLDLPPGMFQQPSIAKARVHTDHGSYTTGGLPVRLIETPNGILVRTMPRAWSRAPRDARGMPTERTISRFRPADQVTIADAHNVRVTPGIRGGGPVAFAASAAVTAADTQSAPVRVPDAELDLELAVDGWHLQEVE